MPVVGWVLFGCAVSLFASLIIGQLFRAGRAARVVDEVRS